MINPPDRRVAWTIALLCAAGKSKTSNRAAEAAQVDSFRGRMLSAGNRATATAMARGSADRNRRKS